MRSPSLASSASKREAVGMLAPVRLSDLDAVPGLGRPARISSFEAHALALVLDVAQHAGAR